MGPRDKRSSEQCTQVFIKFSAGFVLKFDSRGHDVVTIITSLHVVKHNVLSASKQSMESCHTPFRR